RGEVVGVYAAQRLEDLLLGGGRRGRRLRIRGRRRGRGRGRGRGRVKQAELGGWFCACGRDGVRDLGAFPSLVLEGAEDGAGAVDHGGGEAGELRDLDAERAAGAAGRELAEEDDLAVPLARGDADVADARVQARERRQLVVVRREERLGAHAVVQVLGHGPGD